MTIDHAMIQYLVPVRLMYGPQTFTNERTFLKNKRVDVQCTGPGRYMYTLPLSNRSVDAIIARKFVW